MQEVEYGSQLPHRPEGPPRQLRRRGRLHQRGDDLAALLSLLRRLVLSLLLLLLLLWLTRWHGSSGSLEPSGGSNGARARRPVTPINGRCRRGGGGVIFGIGFLGVIFGRGGSVVGDRRRGGFTGHGFSGDQVGLGELCWDYM